MPPRAAYDHVVVISVDTLRSDVVNANPWKLWPRAYPSAAAPRTDGLDELAGEGAFFPRCITAAPYTSASHATYFTGCWPRHHGVFEFFNRKLASPTLFTLARRAGYPTIFKVDFPIILGPLLGFDRDVDHYIVEDDAEFLGAVAGLPRAFSFAHFGGLHVPYGFHNLRYGGQDYERKVEALEAEIGGLTDAFVDQVVETYREGRDLELLLRYKRAVLAHYARGDFAKLFALYLEGADYFFRRRFDPFLRALRQSLAGRRHLIVVFGDHGHDFDAESCGHFSSLAEGVLRVPLIIAGTDIPHAIHADRIRSVDLAPTLVELLGWPSAARRRMDGASLAPAIVNREPYPVRAACAQTYASEIAAFVDFQQRVLAGGTAVAPRNLLHKEVVYDGALRLVRQHHEFAAYGAGLVKCEPRITLEAEDGNDGWRPCDADVTRAGLEAMLDTYNATGRLLEVGIRYNGSTAASIAASQVEVKNSP